MEPNQGKPIETSDFKKFMKSYTARIIVSVIIILLLLIPTQQVAWLIKERKERQEQVNQELKDEWGPEFTLFGAVLEFPLNDKTNSKIYVYPEKSTDHISTDVIERYRGIFKSNLFTATVTSENSFDLTKLKANANYSKINWKGVKLLLATGKNVRFNELTNFVINGETISVAGQNEWNYHLNTVSNSFEILPSENTVKANYKASVNGTQALIYRSLASQSEMKLSSNWKDPAFSGSSLPENGSFKLTPNGFDAKWKTLSEIGSGSKVTENKIRLNTKRGAEIKFITTLDQYQLNERTIKYCILVLTLTFAVFFLVQIVGKTYVHPLHYLMIGLALLLFYSLLLSLSEHLGFNGAYVVSASAIVLLIVWYAKSILNSMKFAIICGLSVVLLYGFLLVLVNLEVYALLVGSIGLLLVLASIMSVTRKLNFE